MLFNSFEFIVVYLPLTLGGYWLATRLSAGPMLRITWLAIVSVAFYGYWEPRFLVVIGVSITLNYLFARFIGSEGRGEGARKLGLVAAVALNLAAIAFYKYLNFVIDIVSPWRCTPLTHVLGASELPLGISFFTFTQIAYLVDVYQGHPRERNLVKYLLFVTWFPHLIAGPILHHKEMMPQFADPAGARVTRNRFAMGITIFAIGLFKKTVIADGFSLISNPVFKAAEAGAVRMLDAWTGALAYTVQIYYDFSGYSDMAIGLSLLFGIVLPFNFDSPYKSRSIVEFWRRWHITLSRFLRDYVYVALGGNRLGESRRTVNLAATMLIGGLWHGAGWTFILWGALHGLYLVINHGWRALCGRVAMLGRVQSTLPYSLGALALTQFGVVIAWVVFRAEGMGAARNLLRAMAGGGKVVATTPALVSAFELSLVLLAYAGCLVLPNVNAMFARDNVGLVTYHNEPTWSLLDLQWNPTARWAALTVALLLSALLAVLLAGDGTQFLYFQF